MRARDWATGAGFMAMAAGLFFACGGGDDDAGPGASTNDGGSEASVSDSGGDGAVALVDVALHRTDAGIAVTVTIGTDVGPPDLTMPTITATNGTVGPLKNAAQSSIWDTTITPSGNDVEVAITASAHGASVTKTALVLDHVDDELDQAELVGGLVNTTGVEDGANVSPDGEWLVVASYAPIDYYSCIFAGATMDQPACSTVIGPSAAPERPNMLGADRIHDGTFDSHCPSLGLTAAQTHAFFPTAAYVFHRQGDGTFAEPHVLGANADGCLGPYGYSFTDAPSGTSAGLVFSHDDPLDSPDTKADIYFLNATLGQDNLWGTYAIDGGAAELFDMKAKRIPPVLPSTQGNPAFSNGVLAWDDEDLTFGDRDLFFAPVNGTLPAVTVRDAGTSADGGTATLGPSTADGAEIQPAFDGDDLYWYGPTGIERATKVAGATDLRAKASWSTTTALIGASGSGAILAVGEPTIAHHLSATKELYFVAIVKTAAGGLDGVVARVPFK